MAKESPGRNLKKEIAELAAANEELREKNQELEETLEAIRSGEVDAIVVAKGDARKIYTLEGADHPYRVLVENIREGALTLSRAGMILYANSRFADMVQLPPDRVTGSSLIDYVCPESQADIVKALFEITKKACRARVRIRQKKGSLPVLISMNPLSGDQDTKISVVITDRRKDEDRIQLQARMLAAVGDAVIAADLHNRIIYWNDAATRTYGWTPEEAIGRDLIEVATPKISHREARGIADRLKNVETWAGEYVVKHRDGHEFPIYASDAPIFDDDGKLIAIIGASHDISEQKQAERDLASRNLELNSLNEDLVATHEELRQTNDQIVRANEALGLIEEELRNSNEELTREQLAVTLERDRVKNLLDIAGVMILALDTKGKVTLINRRGCEILGLPEEEIVGKDWVITFIPPEIREGIRRALRKVLDGEIGEFRSHENPVLAEDGEKRHILWSNALIRDDSGLITGLLSSGEDITDRKQMEEALRASEARFRTIAENAPSVLQRFDRQLRVMYISSLAEKFTGIPNEAIIGKTNREIGMPEDLCALWEKAQNEVFETGQNREVEFDIMTPGGKKTFFLRFAPERAPDGSVTTILGISTEITERKRAEEALRESEGRYRSLVDAFPDGVVVHRRGVFLYANPAALRLYGAGSLAELAGKKVTDLIHPDDRPRIAARMQRAMGGGTLPLRETVMLNLDGTPVPVETVGGPVLYRGEPAAQIIIRDISPRKEAERALRESEERYRTLFTDMQEGFYRAEVIFDHDEPRDFRYIEVNPAFEQLMGMSRDQLVGRTACEVLPGINPVWARVLGHVARTGKPARHDDYSDALRRHFEAFVFRPNEQEVAVLVTDVTERKRAEHELKRKHKELRSAFEELASTQEELRRNVAELTSREAQLQDALAEKEVLLSEIHHRVKNNLTAFISLLSLDGSYEKTDAGQALRKDLQNRARSMALIHETLYRTGKFSSVDMQVYLTTLIGQVAGTYAGDTPVRTLIDAKGVVLDLSRATTAGLIINELVTNSFKYAFPASFDCRSVRGEPCTIRIAFTCEDGDYRLAVSDNGCGLPPGLDIASTKSLGLKLVNFLALHQLRAEIEVRSDRGTEFIFRLHNIN
jgi:PAS domain S-box-containing protein